HSSPSSATDTFPRRARKAPRATAMSAGTGGKMFSRAESTMSTVYAGSGGSRASQARNASTTALLVVADRNAEAVARATGIQRDGGRLARRQAVAGHATPVRHQDLALGIERALGRREPDLDAGKGR